MKHHQVLSCGYKLYCFDVSKLVIKASLALASTAFSFFNATTLTTFQNQTLDLFFFL